MQQIRITDTGVYVTQSGQTISYDKNTSLVDYKPNINFNSSWSGILKKGDEVTIQMSKFIFLRARGLNEDAPVSSCSFGNFENYCSPAHNTLINSCGCCSNVGGSDSVLEFHKNSYTNFKLDSKTIYLKDEYLFDCSAGTEIIEGPVTNGWGGCEKLECQSCDENGTPLTNTITVQGSLAQNCEVEEKDPCKENNYDSKGIFNYVFTGVLEDNGIVIKGTGAENDYVCKKDYYVYVKNTNEKVIIIFNNTYGTWNLLKLDTKISDIVEKGEEFEIIEAYNLGSFEQSNILNNTSIVLPPSDVVEYEGEKNILDSKNIIKLNNLLAMESDRFDGKIVAVSDEVKISINIGI